MCLNKEIKYIHGKLETYFFNLYQKFVPDNDHGRALSLNESHIRRAPCMRCYKHVSLERYIDIAYSKAINLVEKIS